MMNVSLSELNESGKNLQKKENVKRLQFILCLLVHHWTVPAEMKVQQLALLKCGI